MAYLRPMPPRFSALRDRNAIIDAAALEEALTALGREAEEGARPAIPLLREVLQAGRLEIAARLVARPSAGTEAASAYAHLTDVVVKALCRFVDRRMGPPGPGEQAEPLLLVAVGGYGRGEMALHSDVDIAFVTQGGQAPRTARIVEAVLHGLWDLGLKLGHACRSLDETMRLAKADLTIRTALMEARYLWGDEALHAEARRRFEREVVAGTAAAFVAGKLAERTARHERMGDTRYVVEPNVKEGKGGLRDLHALRWIGRYAYGAEQLPQLVERGLLTTRELDRFRRAENFLWAVRCHMHIVARRAEDRLTFDLQAEVARRMRYADRPGRTAVERFMRHFFLTAKEAGELTAVFLAQLDETFARKGRRFGLPTLSRRPRRLGGFALHRGRLTVPDDGFFAADPLRLLRLFWLADRYGLEIHPRAARLVARDARLIDAVLRADPQANALFLDVLTSARDPETVLRRMNEAGVLGRFVPDFGRVVAQMQFDMYHHYTVDEHTLRAIGLLSRIERGLLREDHPRSSAIVHHIVSRRVLYVAVLLHDIAKGRGGDHSVLGAEVAERLCPRLGLSAAETDLVAWLVRHHLLLSETAFKRDLADPKTIGDFVGVVQSPERLRLLLVLTVVDIRAVGPGIWNGWKRQLVGDLFDTAEEVIRLGHKQRDRRERIGQKRGELQAALGWPEQRFEAHAARLLDSYWVAEDARLQERNARLVSDADGRGLALAIDVDPDPARGATLVTVYAADHPGLFTRVAGGISLAGANIIDARIHTTRDGRALDNFLVQDPLGRPFGEPHQLQRLREQIAAALEGTEKLAQRLAAKPGPHARAHAFTVVPTVLVDNRASNRHTVVEIHAGDRPALLNALASAFFRSNVTIRSARIATFGERAVDVFYVTDLAGEKIRHAGRLRTLERLLLEAAEGSPPVADAA